jgi:quercetin dioxygenase-like cupin family protein
MEHQTGKKENKMELDLMKKVFRKGDTEPFEVLPSGHTAWLLAKVDNLTANIFESKQVAEFPSPCHQEEEFIYVLEGHLEYDDGRVARAGEAVYNLPNIPHPGRYTGRLLDILVCPETGTSPPSKDSMSKVIRVGDIETHGDVMASDIRRILLITENVSFCITEAQPGTSWVEPGHPEKEIVYILQGQLEYDDGRVVRAGEAIVNFPNVPHPGKRGKQELARLLEIKSPPSSRLLKILEK